MKQYCRVGEFVLAVDNNHLYEAKILRADFVGTWKYFIHYQSWHRKYDCWVDEQLVAKKDDKSKQERIVEGAVEAALAKNLTKKAKKNDKIDKDAVTEIQDVETQSSKTRASTATATVPKEEEEDDKLSGKRKIVETVEQENLRKNRRRLLLMDMVDEDDETFVAKLPIPFPLKKHMIEEHTLLTTPDAPVRLLELPKPKGETVESIIKEFMDEKKGEADKVQVSTETSHVCITFNCVWFGLQTHAYQGLMDGLMMHFDKALPNILLYRQERAQVTYDIISAAVYKDQL